MCYTSWKGHILKYTHTILSLKDIQRQIFHVMMMPTVIPPSFCCQGEHAQPCMNTSCPIEVNYDFALTQVPKIYCNLSSVCLDTYLSCLSADRLADPVLLGWCWFSQQCRGCFRLSWSSSHRLTSPCPGLHANYTREKQSCNLSQKKTTIKQQQNCNQT